MSVTTLKGTLFAPLNSFAGTTICMRSGRDWAPFQFSSPFVPLFIYSKFFSLLLCPVHYVRDVLVSLLVRMVLELGTSMYRKNKKAEWNQDLTNKGFNAAEKQTVKYIYQAMRPLDVLYYQRLWLQLWATALGYSASLRRLYLPQCSSVSGL